MIRLSLGLWRNVTRRKGEYGGLLKQSNGSHGGTVGAWSNGDSLPIPLALYTQSVYPNRVIRNLYATPPSLYVPSAPPCYAFTSVLSVTPCALLCKSFSLSRHISEEPHFVWKVLSIQRLHTPLLFLLCQPAHISTFFWQSLKFKIQSFQVKELENNLYICSRLAW